MTDRDPFKPLSAKDEKPAYSSGGRQQNAARKRMSEAAKLGQAFRKMATVKLAKTRGQA